MTLYINTILLLLSVHLFLDLSVQQCIVANWNDIYMAFCLKLIDVYLISIIGIKMKQSLRLLYICKQQ